jgi:predicted acyl esterase
VTLAGPIKPRLFVSTTGTDADWIVKLIDVYPAEYPHSDDGAARPNDVPKPALTMAGYQQLVRGDCCAANSATATKRRSPSRRARLRPSTSA